MTDKNNIKYALEAAIVHKSISKDLQDIVKKLRLDPDTNVKPKKCYE